MSYWTDAQEKNFDACKRLTCKTCTPETFRACFQIQKERKKKLAALHAQNVSFIMQDMINERYDKEVSHGSLQNVPQVVPEKFPEKCSESA